VTKAPWTAGEDAHGFSVTVTQGFGCSVGKKKSKAAAAAGQTKAFG